MEMKLDMARQNYGTKAATGVVMTVDNNKTLLTIFSAWFIVIEVYSMQRYPLICKFVLVSLMYCVILICRG